MNTLEPVSEERPTLGLHCFDDLVLIQMAGRAPDVDIVSRCCWLLTWRSAADWDSERDFLIRSGRLEFRDCGGGAAW